MMNSEVFGDSRGKRALSPGKGPLRKNVARGQASPFVYKARSIRPDV